MPAGALDARLLVPVGGQVPAAAALADLEGTPAVVRIEDGVREIALTRPGRHNALDTRMRDELVAACAEALDGNEPVLLRGDGPSFCSGGDLDDFGTFPDPVASHVVRVTRSTAMAVAAIAPRLVAALRGACLGAGI